MTTRFEQLEDHWMRHHYPDLWERLREIMELIRDLVKVAQGDIEHVPLCFCLVGYPERKLEKHCPACQIILKAKEFLRGLEGGDGKK